MKLVSAAYLSSTLSVLRAVIRAACLWSKRGSSLGLLLACLFYSWFSKRALGSETRCMHLSFPLKSVFSNKITHCPPASKSLALFPGQSKVGPLVRDLVALEPMSFPLHSFDVLFAFCDCCAQKDSSPEEPKN